MAQPYMKTHCCLDHSSNLPIHSGNHGVNVTSNTHITSNNAARGTLTFQVGNKPSSQRLVGSCSSQEHEFACPARQHPSTDRSSQPSKASNHEIALAGAENGVV